MLVALGIAAVEAGHRVRYFTAADSSRPSTGAWPTTPSAKSSTRCYATTSSWSTSSASHRWTTRRPVAVPVRRRSLRRPVTRHRLALAVRVLGTIPARAHHRRQHARPVAAPLPHRRHRRRLLANEASPSERRNPTHPPTENTNEGRGLSVGHQLGPRTGH